MADEKKKEILPDGGGMPNDYRKTNKLHYILNPSQSALVICKEHFMEQLKAFRVIEEKFCDASGSPKQMQGDKYNLITGLLEDCVDYYHVEALAQFVFDENIIPTQTEITLKASRLKSNAQFWRPTRKSGNGGNWRA